jgi:hypothetical protein
MMQLRNDAHFPLSIILEDAESDVQDLKPPRGRFPKSPSIIGASGLFFVVDDPIDMKGHPSKNLTGNADFKIKYGYPGREKYCLDVKGSISVALEPNGSIRGIWFNHAATST